MKSMSKRRLHIFYGELLKRREAARKANGTRQVSIPNIIREVLDKSPIAHDPWLRHLYRKSLAAGVQRGHF